ncbi:MAG: hypothetical protein BWY15_02339 [Firmicutes bacterium ADurb.Bin193]|nr:MAG: hypothetical protein BWY15_02339 [Firmicutes bacterium ADurb.Bin193]
MKALFKALCIFLSAVVLLIGGLAIWQKDNISSFVKSKFYSKEEITQQITQNKEEIHQKLNTVTNGAIRDFTTAEEEQIRKGEMTPQQALDRVLRDAGNENPGGFKSQKVQNGQVQSDSAQDAQQAEDDVTSIINAHVSKIYLLKAQYLGQLGGFESRVRNYWNALPAEQRTASGKQATITKFMGELASMEQACDAQVEAVLSSLTAELKAAGGDLSIVGSIRSAYRQEKNLQKAYFINLYN